MSRLPPLHSVRVFEAVVRLRSFTAAATELNLTQSAVSHQVRNLEDFFGFPLLERRNRVLTPTAAGEALYRAAQTSLEIIGTTVSQLRQTKRNQIRIKSFPSIGVTWLVRRLPDFHRRHPGVEVSLTTVAEGEPTFRWDEHDFVVQYGDGRWNGVAVKLLHEERLTPLCAPAMSPPKNALDELERMTIIHPTKDREDWPLWWKAANFKPKRLQREQVFDTDYMAIEAAVRGVGITISDPLFAQEELASGRLVAPYKLSIESGCGYYLISPSNPPRNELHQQFRDWLFAAMKKAEAEVAASLRRRAR